LEASRGDSVVDLFPIDPGGSRGVDRQPHPAALHLGDADDDAAVDHDRFAHFSR
jgi:hypothetical protein